MVYESGAARLLQGDADWTIRDIVAVLAVPYHIYERAGVSDDENPFRNIVNTRSSHFKDLKRQVLPAANTYEEPFIRMVYVARALRHRPEWSDHWRNVVPILFVTEMLGLEFLEVGVLMAVDAILDDAESPPGALAAELNALLVQIPDQFTV